MNSIIDNKESYRKTHKAENKELFTKEEMSQQEKKAI